MQHTNEVKINKLFAFRLRDNQNSKKKPKEETFWTLLARVYTSFVNGYCQTSTLAVAFFPRFSGLESVSQLLMTETVVRRFSAKRVFLNISQYS